MHVAIIGTGLIGCSLGMALRQSGHYVSATDVHEQYLYRAWEKGAVDRLATPDQVMEHADLVVLCIPVDAIVGMLPEILEKMPDGAILWDMGSTKEVICKIADAQPRRADFVALHPMAGVEQPGPEAASGDMFRHARAIICNAGQSSDAALKTSKMILDDLQMKIMYMDAAEHDRQLALVSHLPQFLAYVLSSMDDFEKKENNNWTQLGGGGLKSSVRLGKSDADMWLPVFSQNKSNLLHYIDRYLYHLQAMKNMIVSNEQACLKNTIAKANENYDKLYDLEHPLVRKILAPSGTSDM